MPKRYCKNPACGKKFNTKTNTSKQKFCRAACYRLYDRLDRHIEHPRKGTTPAVTYQALLWINSIPFSKINHIRDKLDEQETLASKEVKVIFEKLLNGIKQRPVDFITLAYYLRFLVEHDEISLEET